MAANATKARVVRDAERPTDSVRILTIPVSLVFPSSPGALADDPRVPPLGR
jgi:hypothetical protein